VVRYCIEKEQQKKHTAKRIA